MIQVADSTGQVVAMAVSDQQGNFDVRLPFDQHFDVAASKQGYTSLDKLKISTHEAGMVTDTLSVAIWKHNLDAAGVIYSNESQQPLAGVVVRLENVTKGTIEEIVTGESGQYQFAVTPNHQYRLQATKPGFLPEGFLLNTAGLYRGRLLNDLVLEEEFLEKFEVLFEFDKKDVRPEFTRELDKIVKDLKRAPTATLHVGAHADTQGTAVYNQRLSEARAQEVLRYMTSRGIAPARIEAVGFGEELILNRCSDGVECTDEEHAKNRRAEIKIQLPRADKE
jgi:outer membrane protein OmpA-like peptidoglycan-associated protein